ncbi:hypothetical protein HYS94_03880 [Candidatus Daviesbacteria bacterium]|nr:hypothetical protein [Candidatus Daviesbacteria bacterium]
MAKLEREVRSEANKLLDFDGLFRGRPLNSSLRSFTLKRIIPQIEQNLEDGVGTIIWDIGLPGSGKTYVLKILHNILVPTFPYLQEPHGLAVVTFEKGGINVARQAAFIETAPHELRQERELNISGMFFQANLFEAVRNHRVVLAEAPVITGSPLPRNRFIGVDTGGRAAFQLMQDNSNLLPNYRMLMIGIIAGPTQKWLAINLRQNIKEATDLEDMQNKLRAFDVPEEDIPQTEEEFKLKKLEGASAATILKYYEDLPELSRALRREKRMPVSAPLWLTNSEREVYQDMARQCRIIEYYCFLARQSNLHIAKEDCFSGYNKRSV